MSDSAAERPGGNTPGLAGPDRIGEVLAWIQAHTMGDPDRMAKLYVERGIDPSAMREAADVMLKVAMAFKLEPEDAVASAFMTAGLIGAMLGREQFTVGDLQSD